MYQQGLSVRMTANRIGESPSVIQRLKERWQNTGRVEDRPRSGRPRKTTRQQDRHVVLSCLRDRSATAEALRASLRNVSNVNVSTETVRRRLHAAGLKARRAAVRVPLSRNHRTRRLAFARFHRRWTRNQWSKVLFTDESRFTLRFNDGRIRVWRRPFGLLVLVPSISLEVWARPSQSHLQDINTSLTHLLGPSVKP